MVELSEINKFIESEVQKIKERYKDKNEDELTMAIGFKVIEEIGELFNEILSHKGYQRKDKLDKFDKENIKKEFADVIYTVLFLAKRFDVDIEESIKIKLEEIKKGDYWK